MCPSCRLWHFHLARAMPAIVAHAVISAPRAGIRADRPVDQPLLPGEVRLLLLLGNGGLMQWPNDLLGLSLLLCVRRADTHISCSSPAGMAARLGLMNTWQHGLDGARPAERT